MRTFTLPWGLHNTPYGAGSPSVCLRALHERNVEALDQAGMDTLAYVLAKTDSQRTDPVASRIYACELLELDRPMRPLRRLASYYFGPGVVLKTGCMVWNAMVALYYLTELGVL